MKQDPELIHSQDLHFFKQFLISYNARIPAPKRHHDWDDAKGDGMRRPEGKKARKEEPKKAEGKPAAAPSEPLVDELLLKNEVTDDEWANLPLGGDDASTEASADEARARKGEAREACQAGDHAGSIRALTQALAANVPDMHANLLATRATCLNHLKRPTAALRDCVRALEINRDSGKAWKARANASRMLGKYEDALEAANRALRIDPDEEMQALQVLLTKLDAPRALAEREKRMKEEAVKAEKLAKAHAAHLKAQKEQEARREKASANMHREAERVKKVLQEPEVRALLSIPEVAMKMAQLQEHPERAPELVREEPRLLRLLELLQAGEDD